MRASITGGATNARHGIRSPAQTHKPKTVANKGVFVPYIVIKRGAVWLTVDTATHKIRGRHASRSRAVTQRRILESLRRKGQNK